ncbi:peptide-methionine (S)-S-oxide reductase MsrA [Antarcticibacterium flavum]|uniref:Peptide methionine sulfoxide reductase MsrA n=1 Tax=Antarcticibacterium flavum TaxID=2058175 RepID=A0A5B7X5A6_9FLAO|nr:MULTISPECIES: peptide-methionine (S)-S-oxide reductase MsrA [Antarcticibacterium]MCM4160022.1 peptide-methionine (S)-S-oxide reductase [Antarcticibacterium sp. W02-3]QCY70390.1 peptide-methionine (S)-S-oxide reductase MsrA [Antarcticibacterium flavum]
MKSLFVLTFSFFLLSCGNGNTQTVTRDEIANAPPVEVPLENGLAKAYFASGCFWCVEAVYESVKGVKESISGYSGGHTDNPTYESSNTGRTGHAEAVEVIYDPEVINFRTLVEIYFGSQDPTQVNGQGPDIGSQYRSIIFFQNEEQKEIIEQVKAEVAKEYQKPIAAEVLPFQKFWVAEDYHQDYEKLNPGNPYIQNVSIPRLNRFKKKFPHLLKENENH